MTHLTITLNRPVIFILQFKYYSLSNLGDLFYGIKKEYKNIVHFSAYAIKTERIRRVTYFKL